MRQAENRPDLSILTIVNRQEVYEEFLRSLEKQEGVSFELLPIFNLRNEYDSARRAYNEAARKAKGAYLLFSHPDIRFLSSSALKSIRDQAEALGDFGVVGVAGAKEKAGGRGEILAGIVHGPNKEKIGDRQITAPEEVQTVDECLFLVRREDFLSHPFPDKPGWHLYAVEYCLDAILRGKTNFVIPAEVWHLSDGKSLDERYVSQVGRLVRERRPQFDVIYTTIKTWPTKDFSAFLYRKYYWLKQRVKRSILRNR